MNKRELFRYIDMYYNFTKRFLQRVKNVFIWKIANNSDKLKAEYTEWLTETNYNAGKDFVPITDTPVKKTDKTPNEELEDYYEACDIFVVSSILPSKTFAVVQLEAMKHSKPVINTLLNTCVNYVSIDKETGLTIEPENSEQLTNSINEMINNGELCIQYGNNARKRAVYLFDIDKNYKLYKNLAGVTNENTI